MALAPRPGFRRTRRGKTLRAVAAGWRALPSLGRLWATAGQTEDRLALGEVRVHPKRMRFAGWDEYELALAVSLVTLTWDRHAGEPKVEQRPMGDACLHAVARRFERGADRSDAAVLRDLYALAENYFEIAEAGGDFRIPAPGGGAWIGERVRYQRRPCLAVRTFVA